MPSANRKAMDELDKHRDKKADSATDAVKKQIKQSAGTASDDKNNS